MTHQFTATLTASKELNKEEKLNLSYDLYKLLGRELSQEGQWSKETLNKLSEILAEYPVFFYLFLLETTEINNNFVAIFNLKKAWFSDTLTLIPFNHILLSETPAHAVEEYNSYRQQMVKLHVKVFGLEVIEAKKKATSAEKKKKSPPKKKAPAKKKTTSVEKKKKSPPKEKAPAKKKAPVDQDCQIQCQTAEKPEECIIECTKIRRRKAFAVTDDT